MGIDYDKLPAEVRKQHEAKERRRDKMSADLVTIIERDGKEAAIKAVRRILPELQINEDDPCAT